MLTSCANHRRRILKNAASSGCSRRTRTARYIGERIWYAVIALRSGSAVLRSRLLAPKPAQTLGFCVARFTNRIGEPIRRTVNAYEEQCDLTPSSSMPSQPSSLPSCLPILERKAYQHTMVHIIRAPKGARMVCAAPANHGSRSEPELRSQRRRMAPPAVVTPARSASSSSRPDDSMATLAPRRPPG